MADRFAEMTKWNADQIAQFAAFQKQSSSVRFQYEATVKRFKIESQQSILPTQDYADYRTPLQLLELETVNGYNLYNTDGKTLLLDLNQLKHFRTLWNEAQKYSRASRQPDSHKRRRHRLLEFKKKFRKITCVEWEEMDTLGNYVSNGTHPQKRADTLSANVRALFDLPFPKGVVLAVAQYTCKHDVLYEHVRGVNFMCVWLQRKCKQLDTIQRQRYQIADETLQFSPDITKTIMSLIQMEKWSLE